jgi:hypothetical protein
MHVRVTLTPSATRLQIRSQLFCFDLISRGATRNVLDRAGVHSAKLQQIPGHAHTPAHHTQPPVATSDCGWTQLLGLTDSLVHIKRENKKTLLGKSARLQ